MATQLMLLSAVAVLLCLTPILQGPDAKSTVSMSMDASGHDHHQHQVADAKQHAMPMQMVFEFGCQTTLWFSCLKTNTYISYIAVLIGLSLLAFVHEGLTAYRRKLVASLAPYDEAEPVRSSKVLPISSSSASSAALTARVHLSALHALSLGLGFLLMLAVMSMNAGVLAAVLAGYAA
ncbi:hypothetical protein Agub_g5802, partial [Astrephomene gubernaculifera]